MAGTTDFCPCNLQNLDILVTPIEGPRCYVGRRVQNPLDH
jgi:hypothetical protein